MLSINGETLSGLEAARLTIFGEHPVSGVIEVAKKQHELAEDRFLVDTSVIPIIGEERMVRNISFVPSTQPNMFDHLKIIAPPGLITFGVYGECNKPYNTHLDIILREYGLGNGPIAPFLGVAIEGIYDDERSAVLEELDDRVGGQEITMSRDNADVHITLLNS